MHRLGACRRHISLSAQLQPDPIFHYVITRRDLPSGIRDAQMIHATGGSARLADAWSDDINSGALWVRDEEALRALAAVLARDGIPHIATVETDGELAGQLTAIGCKPLPKSQLKRYLSSIPRIK